MFWWTFNIYFYTDIFLKYPKTIELIVMICVYFLNLKLGYIAWKNGRSVHGILHVLAPVGLGKKLFAEKKKCIFVFRIEN